jgi:WD40 repeat protein
LLDHKQDVKYLKFKPDSLTFFSASFDNSVKVWVRDEDDWLCVRTLRSHQSTVWTVDLTKSSLCSADDEGNIM